MVRKEKSSGHDGGSLLDRRRARRRRIVIKNNQNLFTIGNFLILLLAIGSRLAPHPPNFTALGAVALFSGYKFRSQFLRSLALPFSALVVTDFVFGFHSTLGWVYLAFVLIVLLGRYARSAVQFTALGFIAATVFFGITNFGVWFSSGMYPLSSVGLATCFAAAVPFFGNTLCSQIVFGSFLLVVNHLAIKNRPDLVRARPIQR